MQLTVNKWGNSAAIRLPKQVVQDLQLKVNDILDYEINGDTIVLKKARSVPELTVAELFADYNGEPVDVKPVIFEPRGNEKW